MGGGGRPRRRDARWNAAPPLGGGEEASGMTPGPLDLAFAPSVDHRGQPSLLRRVVSARRSCTVGGEGKGTGETRLCLVT